MGPVAQQGVSGRGLGLDWVYRLLPRMLVGEHVAGHGWPEIVQLLQQYSSVEGVLLDDFLEQSFLFSELRAAYRFPWCGIAHVSDVRHDFFEPSHAYCCRSSWLMGSRAS